jgi:hypothetical protein
MSCVMIIAAFRPPLSVVWYKASPEDQNIGWEYYLEKLRSVWVVNHATSSEMTRWRNSFHSPINPTISTLRFINEFYYIVTLLLIITRGHPLQLKRPSKTNSQLESKLSPGMNKCVLKVGRTRLRLLRGACKCSQARHTPSVGRVRNLVYYI